MPEGLIALLPLILGSAAAATTVGTSIYNATNQPGTPKPAPPAAPNPADASKTRATQEAALSQQLPGLQAQTGGSLSPEALLQLSTLLSGQAGSPGIGGSVQDLLQKMNGGGGGGSGNSPGLTPGGAFG
jgi:hypothetical protein